MRKLRPIAYHEPGSLSEASELLLSLGANGRILAGGTDLLVVLRRGKVNGASLVNIKKIPGLNQIKQNPDGSVEIGALVQVSALESVNLSGCAALTAGAKALGHRSIRNMATIGGNIGRASPASELAAPLLVLGASARVHGPEGERDIPISGIFAGPGRTVLNRGEIITAFKIPAQPDAKGWYARDGRGYGSDCALAGVAVQLRLKDKKILEAKVALTAVGPTPLSSPAAERVLNGKAGGAELFARAAMAAAQDARPQTDFRASARYRLDLVRNLSEQALATAFRQ